MNILLHYPKIGDMPHVHAPCAFNMLSGVKMLEWEPGIGDPTFLGWFTVTAYLLAGLFCWFAAARARSFDPRARWFWMLFAGFMLALGVNKQLDLQSLFTAVLKQFAKSTGWYEDRRIFQAMFISAVAFFGFAFAVLAWVWTSRVLPQNRLALVGGIFLLSFIVIRAASFHHIDQILGAPLAFLRINHVLELGGIACVAVAALKSRRGSPVGAVPRTAPAPRNWKGSATGYQH